MSLYKGAQGKKRQFNVEDQEKRNFISDLYNSAYGDHVTNTIMTALNNALIQNTAIPVNAARHPLVKNGRVKPLMLQPLFKEIDERDFGGRSMMFSTFSAQGSIEICNYALTLYEEIERDIWFVLPNRCSLNFSSFVVCNRLVYLLHPSSSSFRF